MPDSAQAAQRVSAPEPRREPSLIGFAGTIAAAGLSIEAAAQFLGLGRSLVYTEIRAGRLVAHKAGRRTVILREDAERYLRGLPTVEASAPDATRRKAPLPPRPRRARSRAGMIIST